MGTEWGWVGPGGESVQCGQARQKTKEKNEGPKKEEKKMAVPGFEPGSNGSQPFMLTTTLYHQITS